MPSIISTISSSMSHQSMRARIYIYFVLLNREDSFQSFFWFEARLCYRLYFQYRPILSLWRLHLDYSPRTAVGCLHHTFCFNELMVKVKSPLDRISIDQ